MEADSNESDSTVTPRSLSPSPGPAGGLHATPSPECEAGSSVGRPRKSPVWDYFLYYSSTQKSVCQVVAASSSDDSAESPQPRRCGHVLADKFATNLKYHRKKAHPAVYQDVLAKEESAMAIKERTKKPRRPNRGQLTLEEAFQRKYDTSSHRCQLLTRKLAIFVGATSVPNSLVENAEFKALLEALDPRYPVPSRTLISKEIDKVFVDMKNKIGEYFCKAQKVSLCTDVWTKKGMTGSYLGITAHFFSHHDHKCHRVTIAVRRFPHPHTAENIRQIVEEVLHEWSIPLSKVKAILTDNASNMVKAFRQEVELAVEEDSSDESDNESTEALELEDDEEDFETRELNRELTFHSFCKRLSFFAHTLQLVVHTFTEDCALCAIVKRVQALVHKVNKSSRATEMLVARCGKKLVGSCPTRWSSTYLMIERVHSVKVSLTRVLDELEWDNLAVSEWKVLENILKLLKPFAQYTALSSGEDYTTLSSVIPVIM